MKCKTDEMYLPMPKSTTDVSASTDSMISLRSPRRSICKGVSERARDGERRRDGGKKGMRPEGIKMRLFSPGL